MRTATVMDPLRDSRCLVTPESIVIDGANGVCAHARGGPRSLATVDAALAAAVALVILFALLARSAGYVRWIRAGAVLCAFGLAIPGYRALAAQRADAPARIGESARTVAVLAVAIERFAAARSCVEIARDECLACEPIVRFATAGYLPCPVAPRRRVMLGPDAFHAACTETSDRLVCGHLAPAVIAP